MWILIETEKNGQWKHTLWKIKFQFVSFIQSNTSQYKLGNVQREWFCGLTILFIHYKGVPVPLYYIEV
jgi:hypothetical protein